MKVLVLSNNIDAFYIQEETVTIYVRTIESHVPTLVDYDHVMIDLMNSSVYIDRMSEWKKQFKIELEQFANNGGVISIFCAPIDVRHYNICPSNLFENIFPIECSGVGYVLDDVMSLEVSYDVAFDINSASDLMKISSDKTLFYQTRYFYGVLRLYAFSLNVSSKKAFKQMIAYFLLYDGKTKLAVATQEQMIAIYQSKAGVINGEIIEHKVEETAAIDDLLLGNKMNEMQQQFVADAAFDASTLPVEQLEKLNQDVQEKPVDMSLDRQPLSDFQSRLVKQASTPEPELPVEPVVAAVEDDSQETIFSRSNRTQQAMTKDMEKTQSTSSLQTLVVTKEKEDFEKTRELQGLISEVNERTAVIEKVEPSQDSLDDQEGSSSNSLLIILIAIIIVSIIASGAFVYFAFFS